MNIEQALRNFNILLNLPDKTRLHVTDNHTISYDNRWFLGVMRTLDRSSRNDIVQPIYQTFTCIAQHNSKSLNEILECIQHIRHRIHTLYPDFPKIFEFLNILENFTKIYLDHPNKQSREYVNAILNYIDQLDELVAHINEPAVEQYTIHDTREQEDSNMDDTHETQNTQNTQKQNSNMDDTDDDMPPLIDDSVDIDDDESDDEEAEEEDESVPIVVHINPLLHRGLENTGLAKFKHEVTTRILPQLKKETEDIMKSFEQQHKQQIIKLKRRFVKPTQSQQNQEDFNINPKLKIYPETQTQLGKSQDVCINIPSISQFFNLPDDHTPCQLCDDEMIQELIHLENRQETYLDKFMTEFELEVADILETTTQMCKSVNKFFAKYI